MEKLSMENMKSSLASLVWRAEFKEGGAVHPEGDMQWLCKRADQSQKTACPPWPCGYPNSECCIIIFFFYNYPKPHVFFLSYVYLRFSTLPL